jgi:hypothetical protein
MSVVARTDDDFAFRPLPSPIPETEDIASVAAVQATAPLISGPLGSLSQLPGTWVGEGFNSIWRPHDISASSQDRFLELNLTSETLVFTEINGDIPNRGLFMPDIVMRGLTYMQQISERNDPTQGLHIEPGIWAHVPATTNPAEPRTVVRMASIPHGTTILAQGRGTVVPGAPAIPDNNIIPFGIHQSPPPNSAFQGELANFPEMNLSVPTPFRFESPGVTQQMVRNPNSVLQQAFQGQTIENTLIINVTTNHVPIKGGGTANTAFLQAAMSQGVGGNAKCVEMTATFWVEQVKGQPGQPDKLQLQYSQLVQLDFNDLRWPHVTVATLTKQ